MLGGSVTFVRLRWSKMSPLSVHPRNNVRLFSDNIRQKGCIHATEVFRRRPHRCGRLFPLSPGGIFAAQCDHIQVLGPNSFSKNTAKFYGGAISLSDPVKFNINGARFESNSGASGGAVSVKSTEGTTGGFADCWFDSNDASNGGALHLSTGYTGESENRRFVGDSVFVNNVAGESWRRNIGKEIQPRE